MTTHEAGGCAPPVHSAELPLVDFLRDMARNTANIDRRVAHRLNEAADALARQGGAPALEQIKARLQLAIEHGDAHGWAVARNELLGVLGSDYFNALRDEAGQARIVAWTRTEAIRDANGYSIGTDEPEVRWGSEHPDPDELWFPLYDGPAPAAPVSDEAGEAVELHSVVTKFKPTGVLMSVADVMNLLGLVADDDPSLPPHLRCGPEFVREAARCGIEALRALTRPAPAAEAAPQQTCPYRSRCDCIGGCKYGLEGKGAEAAPQGGGDVWQRAYKEVAATPLSEIRERYGTGDVFAAVRCRADELSRTATPPSAPAAVPKEGLALLRRVEPSAPAVETPGDWVTAWAWKHSLKIPDAAWDDLIRRLSAPVPQSGVDEAIVERAEAARVECLQKVTSYGSAGVTERHHMAMRAALKAALAAGALPQGMVLVPREPTQEQVRAGTLTGILTPNQASAAYQAMLAAAPAQGVR